MPYSLPHTSHNIQRSRELRYLSISSAMGYIWQSMVRFSLWFGWLEIKSFMIKKLFVQISILPRCNGLSKCKSCECHRQLKIRKILKVNLVKKPLTWESGLGFTSLLRTGPFVGWCWFIWQCMYSLSSVTSCRRRIEEFFLK